MINIKYMYLEQN